MATKNIITIDGPSGSGKGTVSRAVAAELGWRFLDSGALYRILALAAQQSGLEEPAAIARLAEKLAIDFAQTETGDEQILLNGADITPQVRAEETGNAASKIAAEPVIRQALVSLQQAFCGPQGLVADGRDMGTVIFPQARLKIFLTASVAERAQRRHKQLNNKGNSGNLDNLFREISERDKRDAQRAVSPLVPAPDAVTLDTTGVPVADVIEKVLGLARTRFG
ncbi:MAG TPA: (d)CMP kinase [Gammaproteobacteria bacterium]|nr:(d)CMP kinase [Gammaproteobacteria bacterium]